MNNFAGFIALHPTAAPSEYLHRLQRRFPVRTSRMAGNIAVPDVQAIGGFQASALNDEQKRSQLFLDGEIFNAADLARGLGVDAARWTTATLLHHLILRDGLDATARVNGQFLIVYIEDGIVHLLNDHSGVQQVFYHQGKNFFLFASDIKFILAHPQCPSEIDWASSLRRRLPHTILSSYRSYATWFKDIHLLPEATDCSIRVAEKRMAQRRYWNALYDYEMPSPDDSRKAADVMEEYFALLDDAVKIRITDGDRACSFLSGGLDSSAVCALAARYRPLDSFSIINQTTVIEDTTSVCDNLARDLGFSNAQFLIPYHELVFDKQRWKQRIWRTESPVNHTDALTKNLLHYAMGRRSGNVPYVLTGTGSDQYNGGLVRWVVADAETEEQSADAFLAQVKDAELRKLIPRDEEGLWRMRKLVSRDFLQEISGEKLEKNYWMYYPQAALHGQTYSLLWDEVRAASAHGRSVRFPFLDYRFAQFIASVPERLHRELFYDKQILRTPSKKLLPDYVTAAGKAPSYHPGYDFRFKAYNFLTSGADSLLEEAFGSRGTAHAVIDTEQLWKRVEAIKQKPEAYEWQELMHIINLRLLEDLASKDERDLDFEKDLEAPREISFAKPAAANSALKKRLGVKCEEEMLALPLRFCDGCGLMQDYKTGALFLAKNNTLAYELDADEAGWIALLKGIDGERSTREILKTTGISFNVVREYFMLSLKEELLCFGSAVEAPASKEPIAEAEAVFA